MYTVSILSQTSRQWRSIQVKTLSQAVQLTLGLSTDWHVTRPSDPSEYNWSSELHQTKQYRHALRALVQRWKHNDYSPVACYRFTDAQLLAWLSNMAYKL